MTKINQLAFLSVLWMSVFFTSCNGQLKTNLPIENATISGGQPKLIKTLASQKGDNVQCSLQDRKGNLWFATTSNGVYRYDGKTFKNFTTKDGLNSNAIFSILEDKKGNIWFGTDKGLSHYDARLNDEVGQGKIFTDSSSAFPKDPSIRNSITSILEDKNGKLWFGTYNGVYCYDGKATTRFLENQNVVNNNNLSLKLVTNMIEDKDGNIWFTTRTEGVCRYDGKSIINYKPDNEEWFRGLLEDRNGNIWVGTRYKGVYRYDVKSLPTSPSRSATAEQGRPDGFAKIFQNGRFDSYTVLSIIQDKSGNIWFGTEAGEESKRETEGGVWRYDGETLPTGQAGFQNISKKDDLSHPAVWSILGDKSGNLWIGTRNTGLCRYDGKTFTSFSE